jgi:8-oxo-dGTP pyrophosphatase MutT (NUDIX family)
MMARVGFAGYYNSIRDAVKVPISVKGIVFEDNRVWLRRNKRNEWELPGGKLDEGEQPGDTILCELREELGLQVEVAEIIQAHLIIIAHRGCLVSLFFTSFCYSSSYLAIFVSVEGLEPSTNGLKG